MKIIGLTGGIACGKTTVAEMLEELGATIIDADAISHELTAPGGEALPLIHEAFGRLVFFPDGTLNREVLSALVFSNEEERKTLNAITHPMILARLEERIATCRKMGSLIVVLDVPLLFEVGAERLADVTVCTTSPQEVQIERMRTRSGLNREQALKRIASQMPLSEKESRSDVVLDTNKPLQELQKEVQKLYNVWVAEAI
ncbi:MAG: dephospho-CoA kinase [Clostridiales bacterium]|nr:dephospho-CoA kinase [Clostridiales bacterium]